MGVQEQAAGALRNLSINAGNKVLIRSSWGVAALTKLLHSSPSDEVKSVAREALDMINS